MIGANCGVLAGCVLALGLLVCCESSLAEGVLILPGPSHRSGHSAWLCA